MRGRPWTSSDRTGGPLDELLDHLRMRIPGLIVERLEVKHPADDDNVYFIGDDHGLDRIQVDTHERGQPPFYIENGGVHEAPDVSTAADVIASYLQAP